MEHRSRTLEDLPPLQLSELRALELDRPPADGRPAHVSAASGVVRRGDFVYVIGDDLLALAEYRMSDPGPGRLRPVLPAEGDDKPDLEVLTLLPPFAGHAHGALLGLGSGSKRGRDRGFAWSLSPDGSLRGEPAVIDLGPLYGLLGERIDGLDVEGACAMADRLWLLHRGDRGARTNVVAELSLERVVACVDEGVPVPAQVERMRAYDLGELDGVELTFSDATPLGGDLLAFTASAESGGGAIRGSVVGTIDLEGRVRRLRTIDRRYKVEGIHASVDTGVMDLLFVCDQDDPATPSPLLSAAMPLEASVEQRDSG